MMAANPHLRRAGHPVWAPPPVKMVHLGLGGFFRAHTAWYTAHAEDAAEWGIAAFSGRSRDLADRLVAQDGLYTLTTPSADADAIEVIPNLVAAYPGTDVDSWRSMVAAPALEVVTLTVTEAAYRPGAASVAERLVDGLVARRAAGARPITVVSCDNLADNASVLTQLLDDAVARHGDGLAEWVTASVRIVGSVVDRITPAPTSGDVAAAARHGWIDAAPVVTEPFAEWVLCGAFAEGRPTWESAGAVIVDDLAPYARRKVYLLNGAHSLLAYAGMLRGHTDVAEAMADSVVRTAVETWWDQAEPFVASPVGASIEGAEPTGPDPADLTAYRAALVERFENPRMGHRLAQIAIDGSVKLPVRVVPVLRACRAAGRDLAGGSTIIGAWTAAVQRARGEVVDARAQEIRAAFERDTARGKRARRECVRGLVALLDDELASDDAFIDGVDEASEQWLTKG